MFVPEEFITFASEVAHASSLAGSPAVRARTAYGRMYYGLFLIIRAILVQRHGVPVRRVEHGRLFMRLQHSTIRGDLRDLGRELERLYSFRQQADYVVAPTGNVREMIEDPAIAAVVAGQTLTLANRVAQFDFAPLVGLLLAY